MFLERRSCFGVLAVLSFQKSSYLSLSSAEIAGIIHAWLNLLYVVAVVLEIGPRTLHVFGQRFMD